MTWNMNNYVFDGKVMKSIQDQTEYDLNMIHLDENQLPDVTITNLFQNENALKITVAENLFVQKAATLKNGFVLSDLTKINYTLSYEKMVSNPNWNSNQILSLDFLASSNVQEGIQN